MIFTTQNNHICIYMLILKLVFAADRMFLKRLKNGNALPQFDRLPWAICRELPLLRYDVHVAVGLWV